MCLSDPVHRRPVAEKYCSHLRREELVRYCNQDVNCAEWSYGEETPVSFKLFFSSQIISPSFTKKNKPTTTKKKLNKTK